MDIATLMLLCKLFINLRPPYKKFENADRCRRIYGNENEVGQGIRDNGVPRQEIFLTSKLWNTHHPNVQEGLQQSLDALGVDYLDLYLIHWPVRLVPNETHPLLPTNPDGSRAVDRSWDMSKTWLQMEEVYKTGKARAIGVANWSVLYLEALSKSWNIVPAVNQVELHPFLPQHELKRWCKEKGILLEAYSPLGSSGAPLQSDPAIQVLATKYSVQPVTILISYHVNQGVVVLPKSVTEARITQNRNVIKFEKEDLVMLDSLASQEGKAKRLNTPLWGFDLGFDDWYGPVARK
ncbi:Aldo/keto reductase [Hortaea werneckii]|nr:Aldo/keto reductase [Hortaea werneckii]